MVEFKLVLMVILGLLTHTLLHLAEIKTKEGVILTPVAYFKRFPFQTLLSLIGCIVGYIILDSYNELTLGMAYALGTYSNVVAEKLGQANLNKVLNK